MSFSELLKELLLLSNEEKKKVIDVLSQELVNMGDGFFNPNLLPQIPEWEGIEKRATEVVLEEKACLVHFDDHIQHINQLV